MEHSLYEYAVMRLYRELIEDQADSAGYGISTSELNDFLQLLNIGNFEELMGVTTEYYEIFHVLQLDGIDFLLEAPDCILDFELDCYLALSLRSSDHFLGEMFEQVYGSSVEEFLQQVYGSSVGEFLQEMDESEDDGEEDDDEKEDGEVTEGDEEPELESEHDGDNSGLDLFDNNFLVVVQMGFHGSYPPELFASRRGSATVWSLRWEPEESIFEAQIREELRILEAELHNSGLLGAGHRIAMVQRVDGGERYLMSRESVGRFSQPAIQLR
ncbi:hypothetical protein BU16DRAFT_563760 [Lophium mytilinum]|uniref:Uncharacterized protein n=1 Tax=Lophium mytilinum TaxID=390894 RepID=A0A6A6QNA0_9PEZI|nr:hypothetical protein BU16DRAFT_563760 [Lophium mytilinum]